MVPLGPFGVLGVLLGGFGDPFGVPMGSLWDPLAVFVVLWGLLWIPLETMFFVFLLVGSLWGPFGIFGVFLDAFWLSFGVPLGSLWGPFAIPLGVFVECFFL